MGSELSDDIARVRIATATGGDIEAALARVDARGPAAGALVRAVLSNDREEWEQGLEHLASVEEPPIELGSRFAQVRGEALLGLGRLPEALDVFDERLGDDPTDRDAEVGRARVLFRMGRHVEAESPLREAVRADPAHFEATYGLGVLLIAKGLLDEALELISRAQELNPLAQGPYRALARLVTIIGAPETGIEAFEELLQNPLLGSPALLVDLANLYAAAGQVDKLPNVLRAIEEVSEVGPGHAVELARLWAEAGRVDEVRGLSGLFVEAHPGHQVLQGLALELEGDLDGAAARYRQALAGAPEMWLANERLASALLDLGGDLDEVELAVGRAEAAAPRTPETRLVRAMLQVRKGDGAARQALDFVAGHGGMRRSLRERAARWLAATA